MTKSSQGFTLVEVLIATAILATGMLAIFSALTPCVAVFGLSKQYQEVRWVLGLAEVKYPLAEFEELEDIVVDETSDFVSDDEEGFSEAEKSLSDGYTFERTIDEKIIEDDIPNDGLYLVRTRIKWGEGEDAYEEIPSLIYFPEGGEYTP